MSGYKLRGRPGGGVLWVFPVDLECSCSDFYEAGSVEISGITKASLGHR